MKKFKNDFMLLINEVSKIFEMEFRGEENIIDLFEKKLAQNILLLFQLAEEAGGGAMKLHRMQKLK